MNLRPFTRVRWRVDASVLHWLTNDLTDAFGMGYESPNGCDNEVDRPKAPLNYFGDGSGGGLQPTGQPRIGRGRHQQIKMTALTSATD